jgi:hypothetical protein
LNKDTDSTKHRMSTVIDSSKKKTKPSISITVQKEPSQSNPVSKIKSRPVQIQIKDDSEDHVDIDLESK